MLKKKKTAKYPIFIKNINEYKLSSCLFYKKSIKILFNKYHILNKKTPIASIMVTHKFKHEDISKALEFAASGQGIKVIIDYEL